MQQSPFVRLLRLALAVGAVASSGVAVARIPHDVFVSASPDGTPWADTTRRVADRVTRLTGGKLRLRAMIGGIGGDEVESARLCVEGKIAMWGGTGGALGNFVPELDAFELPYLFDDEAAVERVLRGPALDEVRRILARRGLVLYETMEIGWRSFAARKPLRRPADFAGLRARSQPSSLHLEMWKALGAAPRSLTVIETLDALQLHLVEAFDNSPLYAFATGWINEVTHYTMTRHSYQPGFAIFCKGALDRLSERERGALLVGAREESLRANVAVRELSAQVEGQLAQALKVVPISGEERSTLRERTRSVHAWYRKHRSDDARTLLAAVQRAIDQR